MIVDIVLARPMSSSANTVRDVSCKNARKIFPASCHIIQKLTLADVDQMLC